MVIDRVTWDGLDDALRDALDAECGPILDVTPVREGWNSQLAAILRTTAGTRVFVKGLREGHPRAWTQQTEAAINPHVGGTVAPRLLWSIQTGGWHLLGFEYIDGRSADLTPGSADLSKVAACLHQLQAVPAPDLPIKRAEHRWRAYIDDPADLAQLAGNHLLHTDYNPDNILITDRAHIVDWAWPTRGAGWIDQALCALWLIVAGHNPADAESWAAQFPSWNAAFPPAVTAFIDANRRLWAEIANDDPDPWTSRVAASAQRWHLYRSN